MDRDLLSGDKKKGCEKVDTLLYLTTSKGVKVWIKTETISSFYYLEDENETTVLVGPANALNAFHFPGNHVEEIIAAIHGWE